MNVAFEALKATELARKLEEILPFVQADKRYANVLDLPITPWMFHES